jgi:Protein of unknown function (DUF998)/Protein of unknown function (DUF3040)
MRCNRPPTARFRQTVSVLAGHAAKDRWIVTGAVYVIGMCHVATAAGLRRLNLRARVGLVVAGLAAIGIAASPQPVSGSNTKHLVFTVIGAVAITVWPALGAQRRAPASILVNARVSAAVSLGFLILLSWTVVETQGGASLGLAERVSSDPDRLAARRHPQPAAHHADRPRSPLGEVSAVGLTEKERRMLDDLAEILARDHPHLARQLTRGQVLLPYRRRLASTRLIAAPPLLVLGFIALQTVVVTIGCLALIVGTTLLAAGSQRPRWKRLL